MIGPIRRFLGLKPKKKRSVRLEGTTNGVAQHTEAKQELQHDYEERWKAERVEYERRLSVLQQEADEQQRDLSRTRDEQSTAQVAVATAQQQYAELKAAYDDQQMKAQQLQSAHDRTTESYSQLQQENDQVMVQLRSARALMGTNDEVSAEEILRSVKDINAVISQMASALSDGLQVQEEHPERDVSRASERLPRYLSPTFLSELRARDHIEDNILVQYGIQACLSYHVLKGTLRFHIKLDLKHDLFLNRLFEKLQASCKSCCTVANHSLNLVLSSITSDICPLARANSSGLRRSCWWGPRYSLNRRYS